jgi:guanylate kinase
MSKIYYILGKSSSGKNTIYSMLLEEEKLGLKPIIRYTTRLIRQGEENGVEYFFVGISEMEELDRAGKLIEREAFHTMHGIWHYFTVDDGQVQQNEEKYLMIGTLGSFIKTKEYYGDDMVVPIYIQVEDGIRLERALRREKQQEEPHYAEMCRRFLADEKDFSEDRLHKAGIDVRYDNIDLTVCLEMIRQRIVDFS